MSRPMPTRAPNVHPQSLNIPRMNDDGFEELCHLVTEEDPDTALCGKDVTGYPWNPPWPRCEACLAVSRGRDELRLSSTASASAAMQPVKMSPADRRPIAWEAAPTPTIGNEIAT